MQIDSPDLFPIVTFSAPDVTSLPAQKPNNILKQALVPSRLAPALVPATKFSSASGENPAEIPVKFEPSPKYVTTPLLAVMIPAELMLNLFPTVKFVLIATVLAFRFKSFGL